MSLLLLVPNDALEKVSRGFREYSRSQGSLALVLALILIFAIAAAFVYAVLSSRDRMVGRRMFLRLSRASGLGSAEQQVLVRIARRVLPDNPPAIFVRRPLYETANADMAGDAALVQSVRKKVYGP